MEKPKTTYVKRTQKDYTMSFKLSVVRELETTKISNEAIRKKYGIQGSRTVRNWLEKFGSLDYSNQSCCNMTKMKDKELHKLESELRMLERKNICLEHDLKMKNRKVTSLDMVIDMAGEECKIKIRKNFLFGQSTDKKE